MTHLLGGLDVQNARGSIINDLRDVSHTSWVRSAIHYLAIYRISIPLVWRLGTDKLTHRRHGTSHEYRRVWSDLSSRRVPLSKTPLGPFATRYIEHSHQGGVHSLPAVSQRDLGIEE